MQSQLLKFILDNPNWIGPTQLDIFTGSHYKLFDIIKKLDSNPQIHTPSTDALRYVCTKKELDNELLTLNEIDTVQPIDTSTFTVMLEDQRNLSIRTFVGRMGLMHDATDEEYKKLLNRLQKLQQVEKVEETVPAGSFFDWESHIIEQNILVGSGLRFLEGTGSDFCKGDLVVIAAPSGNGKSQGLAHMAKHYLMSKKNTLFVVFEESEAKFKSRIAKGLLKMSSYRYRQLAPSQIELLFEPKRKGMGNLDVIAGKRLAVEDLSDIILQEEEIKGYKYDVVIIDYSKQIVLKGANKNAREDQIIANVFRILKEVAMTSGNEKLIVTATQSNRGSYGNGRNVAAENIADSMGAMHNADFVLSLKRKNPEGPQRIIAEEDVDPNETVSTIKMHIIKKREGSVREGSNYYYNLKNCGNLIYCDNDEQSRLDTGGFDNLLDPIN